MENNDFEVEKITYVSHEGSTLYLAVEKHDNRFMKALMDVGFYVHNREGSEHYGIVLAYIDSVEINGDSEGISMVCAKDGEIKYIFTAR